MLLMADPDRTDALLHLSSAPAIVWSARPGSLVLPSLPVHSPLVASLARRLRKPCAAGRAAVELKVPKLTESSSATALVAVPIERGLPRIEPKTLESEKMAEEVKALTLFTGATVLFFTSIWLVLRNKCTARAGRSQEKSVKRRATTAVQ